MTKRTAAYLRLIGRTQESSVILTKGYSKSANELVSLGLAELIPISRGGSHVALTRAGIEKYHELTNTEETR